MIEVLCLKISSVFTKLYMQLLFSLIRDHGRWPKRELWAVDLTSDASEGIRFLPIAIRNSLLLMQQAANKVRSCMQSRPEDHILYLTVIVYTLPILSYYFKSEHCSQYYLITRMQSTSHTCIASPSVCRQEPDITSSTDFTWRGGDDTGFYDTKVQIPCRTGRSDPYALWYVDIKGTTQVCCFWKYHTDWRAVEWGIKGVWF